MFTPPQGLFRMICCKYERHATFAIVNSVSLLACVLLLQAIASLPTAVHVSERFVSPSSHTSWRVQLVVSLC